MNIAINEMFAVRDGEKTTILSEQPTSGRWIAVMAVTVSMPDGPKQQSRQTDGKPIESAAIVASQISTDGLWQWVHLSPATKGFIGDLLFDSNADKNRWYYALVEPN